MNKIENCYIHKIHKDMLRDILDACFWKVMNVRIYFQDELLFTDFMDYALDIADDSTNLSVLLDKSTDKFVHPYIAKKISIYYKSVQDLMFDIKLYLLNNYDIDYNKELENRKQKEKKEGK